jgi:phenylacetate-CoA ligase
MAALRLPVPSSALEGLIWPAVPVAANAQLLGLMHQLQQSQWWPPEVLRRHQFRQLSRLVDHAYRTIPFYAARLSAAGYRPGQEVTEELWRSIPILARREVQEAGTALEAREMPPGHGELSRDSTSGSTGMPIRIARTRLFYLLWLAVALRDELWQGRDFRLKFGIIRRDSGNNAFPPNGLRLPDWGPPVAAVFPTGPAALIDSRSTIEQQGAWLLRERPDYLYSFPSIIKELARWFRSTGTKPPPLRSVRTFGEMVGDDLRALCREVFGAGVSDVYSSVEAGYLGTQCPDHEYHHVPSEVVLLEVLDSAGRPCGPGEAGTVVVTPLHNFAMPLLRYDIGDIAEVGPPCSCGRGLPVLARIVGKSRDIVVLPSGEHRFAFMGSKRIADFPTLLQIQVVQKTVHDLEVRLVTRGTFGAENEAKLGAVLREALGADFAIAYTYHDSIPRSAGGKYFDFLSEVGR